MVEAVIFDFDGLILDTEMTDYLSWKETYEAFRVELPLDLWQSYIGTIGFDLYGFLEKQLGHPVDRDAVHQMRKERDNQLLAQEKILPGVESYLVEARGLGLHVGLASSSRHDWVDTHLQRLGLFAWFETICCRDDVADQAKPNPAVYQLVLAQLGLSPREVLALEDSPNGISAAKGAGVWVTAVPNRMTRHLNLSQADFFLNSLADMSLRQLIEEVTNGYK